MSEAKAPYTTGTWRGMTQYRCSKCPFDTLSRETIEEHLKVHERPARLKVVRRIRRDRFGNPVGGDVIGADNPDQDQRAGTVRQQRRKSDADRG